MIFQIYDGRMMWQILGWVMVFVGLILINEIARRTKIGGSICFFAIPAILTVYFIAIYVGAAQGAEWALNNQTYVHMNSWFHYAKLYAALAGCIGFMVLKYHWGSLGKSHGFKVFPFVIVAINILIAVVSDFESVVRAGSVFGGWWKSSEGVWLYGGWWNILNGIAGILNIFCMTGWWGIYSSRDKKDMLWPDMTWCFILAYDIWNFQYTYLNLPHIPGTAALRFYLRRQLPMRFGIRADGFKTVRIHWHYGVCLRRYFRCFRTAAALQPFPLYMERAVQQPHWGRQCLPQPILQRRELFLSFR